MKSFFNGQSATTAIEYAMVAGGIAVVIVSAVNFLGATVYSVFFAKIAGAV